MKQLLFIAIAFTSAIVTGCGSKSGEAEVEGTRPNPTINMSELNRSTIAPNITPTTTTTVVTPTMSTQGIPPTNPQQTATTNAAGLNPAHGQPGHRCDIAVGAPLNSAPAMTTSISPAQKQAMTTITPPQLSSTTVKTAPGMNPPHGQPGHRCDIAVGAPLNSAPATTTTTTTTTTPSVNSNIVPGSLTPSIIQSSPATTSTTVKTAPGMNPPHGQPGHRCDITVGAPLNSKPEPAKIDPATTEATKTETKKDNN